MIYYCWTHNSFERKKQKVTFSFSYCLNDPEMFLNWGIMEYFSSFGGKNKYFKKSSTPYETTKYSIKLHEAWGIQLPQGSHGFYKRRYLCDYVHINTTRSIHPIGNWQGIDHKVWQPSSVKNYKAWGIQASTGPSKNAILCICTYWNSKDMNFLF